MDFEEAAAVFGSTIPVRYLDNSGVYHDTVATMQANRNTQYKISNLNGFTDSEGYLQLQRRFIQYSFTVSGSLNTQPQSLTLYLQPEYQIFDTEYIYTCLAVSAGSSGTSTNIQAYNSPSWSWVWAGSEVVFSPSLLATNNVLPHLNFYEEGYTVFDFVPAYMDSHALTSGYSISSTFDHVYAPSGKVEILIGLPYVSADAQGATGTPATTTATTSAPSVDLGETNGLLGGISGLISGIVQKVTGIFDALTDAGTDTSVPDAIVTVPPDIDYDDVLDNADEILDDVPDTVAAAGFWWALYSKLFVQDVNGSPNPALILSTVIPLASLLGLLSHVLWKK